MTHPSARPALGLAALLSAAFVLGGYFTFAAVQGEHGMFRRIQIRADIAELSRHRDTLAIDLARIENLTSRLSDQSLDLDLLDERARDVLGYLRTDEAVVH